MGGCKKLDLSSTQGALCTVGYQYFYFTFCLFGGMRMHPTHRMPTGLEMVYPPEDCHLSE